MNKHILVLLFLAALPVIFAQCAKDKLPVNGDPLKFTYLTEEYPTFSYSENGHLTGASVEILDSLFARLSLKIDHSVVTVSAWGTSYDKVLNTPETMMFSFPKTTANDSLFKWVGPIATDTEIAVSLLNSSLVVTEVTDLNNYFTGVVDAYDNVQKLLNHGILRANILIYDNMTDLYKALVDNKEVQFIYTTKAEHLRMIQSLGYQGAIFALPFTVHFEDLYYAFNKATADALITRFSEQLNLLKSTKQADGTSAYDKILSRYYL